MKKIVGGFVLIVGIVLISVFVFSDSKASSSLVKPSAGKPGAIVTELPKGTTFQKGSSSINIPPDTVSPSPTKNLHGIVTPLAKSSFQSNGTSSSMGTPQSSIVPSKGWEIYNRGSYSSSFTGASDANGINSNYLFSVSRSYQLKADMYVTGDNSSTTQYVVELLDHMAGDGVVYSNLLAVGQSVTVTYPNLNPTHVYYLRWSSVGEDQSIDGKYIVHY